MDSLPYLPPPLISLDFADHCAAVATSISINATYADWGPLPPYPDLNEDFLHKIATDYDTDGATVAVIRPNEGPIEVLPRYMLSAIFHGPSILFDEHSYHEHGASLVLVWFQHEWSPLMAPEVQSQAEKLRWENVAQGI